MWVKCERPWEGVKGTHVGPAVNGQSPWVGSGQRPHSVAPHLYFWVGYLASGNLSPWACLWGDRLTSNLLRTGQKRASRKFHRPSRRDSQLLFPAGLSSGSERKGEQTCSRAWGGLGLGGCYSNRSRLQGDMKPVKYGSSCAHL